MQLNNNEAHIWSTPLTITKAMEEDYLHWLSDDECIRAERFRFPIHRKRYIAARAMLRYLLSLYLKTTPEAIQFAYTTHHKPYLPHSFLQFNLAHSNDMAVYAINLEHGIGIDIEKMKENYNPNIAKRFFSQEEYLALEQLTGDEKMEGFYRLWARKEAMIKAVGKGLSLSLSSFSVSEQDVRETVILEHQTWSLMSLRLHPDYQTAIAINPALSQISYLRSAHPEPVLEWTIQF